MVLGKGKKQTFLRENLRQLQPLTRFSPVNCRAFIMCDLVLFREKKREREREYSSKSQDLKYKTQLMFHRVWIGRGEPLKLEKDTNSDIYALERNWVMDEMEVFQKIKIKKITSAFPSMKTLCIPILGIFLWVAIFFSPYLLCARCL